MATNGYSDLLHDPDGTFGSITLAEIVAAWRPLVAGTKRSRWLLDFNDRYVNLDLSAH